MNNLASEYTNKPERYFSGARTAFIDQLPLNPLGRLLEVGCGSGDTAAYALSEKKAGWSAGIELCAEPAELARRQLNDVIVGDVEVINIPYEKESFDALLMSEVIEHLRDPWAALTKLRRYLKAGAWVIAGSPNVAHYSVLFNLLMGRWEYQSMGLMDKTHLRWFTPSSYRALFESCGFDVMYVGPAYPLRMKARCFNFLTLGKFQHLLHSQISITARRR